MLVKGNSYRWHCFHLVDRQYDEVTLKYDIARYPCIYPSDGAVKLILESRKCYCIYRMGVFDSLLEERTCKESIAVASFDFPWYFRCMDWNNDRINPSKEFSSDQQKEQHENDKGAKLTKNGIFCIHKGSLEKEQSCQLDHVPIVSPLVFQYVQRSGNVAVTIVATNVVHPLAVDPVRLVNSLVPPVGTTLKVANVHLEIPCRWPKGHDGNGTRTIRVDVIGPPEIVGSSLAVGYSQVTDKWK